MFIRLKTWLLAGCLMAIGLLAAPMAPMASSDPQPLEVLRDKIEEGLSILNDPRYRDAADRSRQGRQIWELSREIFDYPTMSRLVLSSYWHTFTPEQQETFVREFAAFLRRTYLPDLLEKYNGETIEFVRQEIISANRARVDALVSWRDRQIPVTARMFRRDGQWRVYDVSSLGISAVQNYRAQFQWMLRQETPARVIEILKNAKGRSVDD